MDDPAPERSATLQINGIRSREQGNGEYDQKGYYGVLHWGDGTSLE